MASVDHEEPLLNKKPIKNPKFAASGDSDFSKTLKSRVNDYFRTNNISRYGNTTMFIKSAFMLALYFVPLAYIIFGNIYDPVLLFTLFVLCGAGMAGVGMSVMHDALHGSYSKHRWVNKFMGYAMNLIGANANVWKIQHNVLHHTYTNIESADDDINAPFFLRFSPHAKWYWLHQFQHFYVWIFYGLSTISWVISKDFIRLSRYRKMGFFSKKDEFKRELLKIIGWKLVYYSFALVLPLIMVPQPAWITLLGFLTMHFVTGLSISLVFQTAHIMPSSQFPLPDKNGVMSNEWLVHQMATTTNYSPCSRLFSWFIGGLNYQLEHHLLPHVCHVHYKKLSKVVADTAREFNIPYNTKPTFVAAVIDHFKMLRHLGRFQAQA